MGTRMGGEGGERGKEGEGGGGDRLSSSEIKTLSFPIERASSSLTLSLSLSSEALRRKTYLCFSMGSNLKALFLRPGTQHTYERVYTRRPWSLSERSPVFLDSVANGL